MRLFYWEKFDIIRINKGVYMGNVTSLNQEKVFSKEAELAGRIDDLILEYNGELSLVSVMGILELKKIELFVGQE